MRKENVVSGCLIKRKGWYYVSTYYYVDGQRVTETKSTGIAVNDHKKREAERIKNQMIAMKQAALEKSEQIRVEAATKHLVASCLEKWVDYKSAYVENTTSDGYHYKSKSTIKYFGERNMMIEDLKPRDILEYYEWELAHGRQTVYKNGKTSLDRRTVSDKAVLFKRFLSDAVLVGVIPVNPADNVSVPRVKESKIERITFMDVEQAQCFLNFVKAEPRFKVLYYIAVIGFHYGLRRSELLGLKWDAVNFDTNEIEIKHTVVRTHHQPEHRDTVKSKASHRYLPLVKKIKTCLMELRENQKRLGIYDDKGYIFLWDDGREYNPDYITKLFSKAVKACPSDIPREITLHGLRHSCCAILFEKGWDIAEVQQWLGHSDIQITANIYNHASKRWKNRHGEMIEDLLEID